MSDNSFHNGKAVFPEFEEHHRERARRHAWYTAFAITLLLCVVAGIAYLATDSAFLKVVVCLVAGCG